MTEQARFPEQSTGPLLRRQMVGRTVQNTQSLRGVVGRLKDKILTRHKRI